MNGNGDYKLLVSMSEKEGKKFKQWCRRNNLTMNRAIRCFVRKVTSGNFEFRERVVRNGNRAKR